MALGIVDLLKLKGFDATRPAKLVRHQDPRYNILDLMRRGWFEAYQRFQSHPVFDGCECIVSFVGAERTRARFIGVYRVGERQDGTSASLPPGCPYVEWTQNHFYYLLERETGYEDLENRVIVEWGKGTRRWDQRLNWKRRPLRDKEVLEVLPQGQFKPPFRDYLEFTLTYSELKHLCTNPDVDWSTRLSAVGGVYLILATTTGQQYVGSASGEEGIWGRWEKYAHDGHGGDALLRGLIGRDLAYPEAFTYSILQVLPKTTVRKELQEWESRYKEKLGSRASGLNAN